MVRLNYVKPELISLKNHPDYNKRWVQEKIAEDPSLLGIGVLVVRDAERIQVRAGRLDLLLQDPETNWSCWEPGMSSLPAADECVKNVALTSDVLSVDPMDGPTISIPLAWYPRLLEATDEQQRNWTIAGGGYGIHWPDVDEALSTEGLLRGAPAPRQPSART